MIIYSLPNESAPSSNQSTGRRWFLRSETDRLLTGSMCFSCGLVILRMIHAHSLLFVFMIWNLFLAYVPYVLSSWLSRRLEEKESRLIRLLEKKERWLRRWLDGKESRLSRRLDRPGTSGPIISPLSGPIMRRPLFLVAVCLVWLLFIPNSFYMVTDLFHLYDSHNPRVPEWFDLAMIFSFAWNGLLVGVLSLRQMERLLERKRLAPAIFGKRLQVPLPYPGATFVYPVLGLCSLGVYTGRYLRYNSWDILSNPFQLFADIGTMIIHPLRNQPAWDMIVCYTLLLSFIYTMLKRISRSLA